MPNLGQTTTRLLVCGAILAGGTLVSGVLGGMVGAAASVAGGIFANDLGDIAKRLGQNEDILTNHDLTQAVGLAIAAVIESVARSKAYPAHKDILKRLAKTAAERWTDEMPALKDKGNFDDIEESQLPAIFSTNAEKFAAVRVLDLEAWKQIFDELCGLTRVSIPELRNYLAEKLYATFPSALREVLKDDAAKGGQAFSGMLLLLLGNITATLKSLNTQNKEIVNKLESVATPEQVRQVMAEVETGIRDDLAEIKKAVDSLLDSLRPGLPLSSQFLALIKEKTKDFVGREYVFEAIKDFLRHEEKGYFIIEAEPGVGKSAILAKYVQKTGCVHHFNIQSGNKNRTELFLKSVCTQLIECYQLDDYKNLPEEATHDSDFLERLLNEVTQRGERVIIAIDALDEVDLSSQNPNANVLYLPSHLPDGVYFVMTQRPLATGKLPFHVEAPTKLFDLIKEYPEQSRQDVLRYIRLATARQGVRQWIHRLGLNNEDFITQLADKSDNNFMYLRYVLADIEKGVYQNSTIDKLPQKLQGYYEQHWRRMGMAAQEPPDYKVDIVYTLVELNQPVSTQLVADIVQQKPLTVQQVLNEWEQFLRKDTIESQICYSVYHKSFRDFLYNNETVQASKVKLTNIKARILNNLEDGLF